MELLFYQEIIWNTIFGTVDNNSPGLSNIAQNSQKYIHQFTDPQRLVRPDYYVRTIINFIKSSQGSSHSLHVSYRMDQIESDLNQYPNPFQGKVFLIAYGILGREYNVDSDKVYDSHKAFDIEPTEVSMSVDLDMNQKQILKIQADGNINNSAATVKYVKDQINIGTNYSYLEMFHDLLEPNSFSLISGSSGIVLHLGTWNQKFIL